MKLWKSSASHHEAPPPPRGQNVKPTALSTPPSLVPAMAPSPTVKENKNKNVVGVGLNPAQITARLAQSPLSTEKLTSHTKKTSDGGDIATLKSYYGIRKPDLSLSTPPVAAASSHSLAISPSAPSFDEGEEVQNTANCPPGGAPLLP